MSMVGWVVWQLLVTRGAFKFYSKYAGSYRRLYLYIYFLVRHDVYHDTYIMDKRPTYQTKNQAFRGSKDKIQVVILRGSLTGKTHGLGP